MKITIEYKQCAENKALLNKYVCSGRTPSGVIKICASDSPMDALKMWLDDEKPNDVLTFGFINEN